jgi:hypothetical protein
MRVAHRKFVESRAQKRTNVGGIRPARWLRSPTIAAISLRSALRSAV